MTRKDYELLRDAIKNSHCSECGIEWDRAVNYVASRIAMAIHEQNPRFNVVRFLDDCGVKL